jgi:hypothetical protein
MGGSQSTLPMGHETTTVASHIAGQIKALAMIVAIEGLIPSGMNARRLSPSAAQPAAPPVEPDIYASKWRREQQHQPVGEEPTDPVAAAETRPATRPRSPSRSLLPSRPPNWLTTRRFPSLTGTNAALPIPSSTP